MTIIPAIDLIDGKCVRLTQGDYGQKKIYNENPLEVALQFQDAGIRRLHLVDLDGAKAGAVQNWKVLESICTKTRLEVDFGGGLTSREDVKRVLDTGAVLATVGSVAVKQEAKFSEWLEEFGAEKFFLGADVKDKMIAVHGWLETTQRGIVQFLQTNLAKGIVHVFCTDVSKDGKLEGPSLELYKELLLELPGLQLTASGGVSSMDDLDALLEAGCSGAIVGKAIYENRIGLNDLKKYMD